MNGLTKILLLLFVLPGMALAENSAVVEAVHAPADVLWRTIRRPVFGVQRDRLTWKRIFKENWFLGFAQRSVRAGPRTTCIFYSSALTSSCI